MSVWNVWDLPLWAWRGYAGRVDHLREQEAKRQQLLRQQGLM